MTNERAPWFGYAAPYSHFVREERHFCAVLAHLLMQRGDNLRRFVQLISSRLEAEGRPSLGELTTATLDNAEIYLEFAFLRDRWNQFDLDRSDGQAARNTKKRAYLFALFARVEGLTMLQAAGLPEAVAAFNAKFMGPAGLRVTQDVASPVLWRVPALLTLASEIAADEASRRRIFRDLCRFKWAFRIKPDLVVLIAGLPPLCIEAKLMSPEGRYPANPAECRLFDREFQPPDNRVRQIELQDFMFSVLLESPAQQALISQTDGAISMPATGGRLLRVPSLSWRHVFDDLDCSASLPNVAALLSGNIHIRESSTLDPHQVDPIAGRYFDGTVTSLDDILTLMDERRQRQLGTEVGFAGGVRKLGEGTLDALTPRRWKWRDPAANTGTRKAANWIDAVEFERVIEELRQATTTDE
jgi:hypothetical protein